MPTMSKPNWSYELKAGFDKVISDIDKSLPKPYEQIFNMKGSKFSYEEHFTVAGIGMATVKNERENMSEATMVQGFDTKFTHKTYGKYIAVSKELRDDGRYGTIKQIPRALARGADATINYYTAEVFNSGFTAAGRYMSGTNYSAGSDGQYLFSTAHVREDGGTAWANKPATDVALSVTSLRNGIISFRDQLDGAGIPRMVAPATLLIPNELEFLVEELLKSDNKSGTGDNDINAFKSGRTKLTPVIWDYWLTSPTAWFLLAPKEDHNLYFYWRQPYSTEDDIEFKTKNWLYSIDFRFSTGWSDPRGIYGNAGA